MTLFEIAAEYREACATLANSGMDEQTIADTLEGMAGDFEAKAINIAFVVKNAQAEAAAIAEARAKMAEREESAKKLAARLTETLHAMMSDINIKRISSPFFVMSIRSNPESVAIDDESAIPSQYMVTPPAPAARPDKAALKAALKLGPVSGARLQQTTRLEIK